MRQAPMPRASSVSAVPEGRPHIRDNATPRRNENCHDTNGSKSNPAYVDLGSPCPGFASGDSATVVERCRHHLSTSSMRHHGYPKCPETRSLPCPGETSRPHFGIAFYILPTCDRTERESAHSYLREIHGNLRRQAPRH